MQPVSDRLPSSTDFTSPQAGDAVIADVNRVNAESIAWCLKAYGGFRNVIAAASQGELLQTIRTQRPAVILVSEKLVVKCLRDLFSELAIRLGETRVAVFGDGLTDRQLDLVVNNRITGLLSREDNLKKISEQLTQISAGQSVLSERMTERVRVGRDGQFQCHATNRMRKLTDRQWDVLLKIAEGRRVSEVASDLAISEKAVESHKYRIMRAVGATDRVELCRWAIREGLIEA